MNTDNLPRSPHSAPASSMLAMSCKAEQRHHLCLPVETDRRMINKVIFVSPKTGLPSFIGKFNILMITEQQKCQSKCHTGQIAMISDLEVD